MIKLMVHGREVPFEITKFPDGTSQVWKLARLPVTGMSEFNDGDVKILWLFENESELMHVLQLAQLVKKYYDLEDLTLHAPYLPYGRQDKELNNQLTFALQTLKDVLYHADITRIETFDAHSKSDMVYEDSDLPTVQNFHDHLDLVVKPHVVCFPDAGAAERYKYSFNIDLVDSVCFEKVRNQQTGEITGLKLLGTSNLKGRNILIVDDICDGGMTFIKVAEALKQYEPNRIDLAVSHGLFSKGRQVLHDAGISNIYTTNSLLRNPEGFKVW